MKRLSFLAVGALLAACGQTESPRADEPKAQEASPVLKTFDTSHAGMKAPNMPLETSEDGQITSLSVLRMANPGQPMLVNLWATWCAPCIRELPTLDRLAAETKGKMLVVAVSQDMEGWRAIKPFLAKHDYPNLPVHLESGMKFGMEVKAKGLPLTIFYDAKGEEVWRYAGDREWDSAESKAQMGL